MKGTCSRSSLCCSQLLPSLISPGFHASAKSSLSQHHHQPSMGLVSFDITLASLKALIFLIQHHSWINKRRLPPAHSVRACNPPVYTNPSSTQICFHPSSISFEETWPQFRLKSLRNRFLSELGVKKVQRARSAHGAFNLNVLISLYFDFAFSFVDQIGDWAVPVEPGD